MAIKEHLLEARKAQEKANQHLEAAFREFAQLVGDNGIMEMTAPQAITHQARIAGSISLPELVKLTLQDGRPKTVTEILQENQDRNLGFVSRASNPVDSIDVQLYKIAKQLPIVKVAKRTWKWDHEAWERQKAEAGN